MCEVKHFINSTNKFEYLLFFWKFAPLKWVFTLRSAIRDSISIRNVFNLFIFSKFLGTQT